MNEQKVIREVRSAAYLIIASVFTVGLLLATTEWAWWACSALVVFNLLLGRFPAWPWGSEREIR